MIPLENQENTTTYTPKGIVFIPTYNCTGMCRHCNIDFTIHDMEKNMDINRAIGILHEAKKMGMHSMQITGGEPTMYPEFMLSIIPHAQKLAVRVNKPPTNAYIGSDAEKTEVFFQALKKINYTAGFRISIDPYHNGNIPIEWPAVFTAVYSKYFPFETLTIGSSFYDLKKIFELYGDYFEKLKKYGIKEAWFDAKNKKIYIDGHKIKFGTWHPTMPAREKLFDYEVLAQEVPAKACLGPKGVGYLWVEPDFKVRVCCGNGNGFLNDYIIGDLSRESVSDVVARAKENPFFTILANSGPRGLREKLNKNRIILDKDKKYSFMCELCNEIMENEEYKEIITDSL